MSRYKLRAVITFVVDTYRLTQVLQNARAMLKSKYSQIPQLSVGGKYDLDQQVYI